MHPNEPMSESEWQGYAHSALASWLDGLEQLANGEEDKPFFSPTHKAVVDGVDMVTHELFTYVPLTALFLAISDSGMPNNGG